MAKRQRRSADSPGGVVEQKRRFGTSVQFFCQFVKETSDGNGGVHVDAKPILSKECFFKWLSSRRNPPADAEKTFRKTIQAHCRGSDKRKPFPPHVEQALLIELRKNDPWKFFDEIRDELNPTQAKPQQAGKERRRESGFRKLGFHEAQALLRKDKADKHTHGKTPVQKNEDEHFVTAKYNTQHIKNKKKIKDEEKIKVENTIIQNTIQSRKQNKRKCIDTKEESTLALQRQRNDDCNSTIGYTVLSTQQNTIQHNAMFSVRNRYGNHPPPEFGYCDSVIQEVNRNLEGPNKFEMIDPGFRNVSLDVFLNSLENVDSLNSRARVDDMFLQSIDNDNVQKLRRLWTSGKRSVLESFHDVSCEEEEKVREFRTMTLPLFEAHYAGGEIPDDVGGDIKLIRFLRKTNFDVHKSAQLIEQMLRWRKEAGVDEVRNKLIAGNHSIETLLTKLKTKRTQGLFPFFSLDKHGDIVDVTVFGEEYEDPTIMTIDEFLQEHIYLAEFRSLLLDRLSRSQNRIVKFLWLLDVRSFTYKQRKWVPYLYALAKIDQKYYPHQNSNIVVVGFSRFCHVIWECICHVIDEDTRKDIFIYNAESLKNRSFASEAPDHLATDVLPKWLGGSVTEQLGTGTAKQGLSDFL